MKRSTPPVCTRRSATYAPLLASALLLTLTSAASSRAGAASDSPLPQANPATPTPQILKPVNGLPLTPKRGETIDVGGLALDRAPVYSFRYIARTRPTGGEWEAANPVATTKVACNGNATFHFTDTRDSLRNKLDIHLLPRDKEIIASFFVAPGQRSFFHDLGAMPVADPAQLAEAEKKATSTTHTGTVPLRKGATYFFTATNVNGVDAQCLFRVE